MMHRTLHVSRYLSIEMQPSNTVSLAWHVSSGTHSSSHTQSGSSARPLSVSQYAQPSP